MCLQGFAGLLELLPCAPRAREEEDVLLIGLVRVSAFLFSDFGLLEF